MNQGYQFGTFKGVFTPSILTILGVVMYLRLGWVLGNAGLTGTLLIVTFSSCITFLTGLSLASLATNMRVKGGGAYYIISRSLGIEAGAAIGFPLYMAQALGISFYIAGFSESVVEVFPSFSPITVGVVTLVSLTAVAYYSAALALKSQLIIMLAILASLVSFFWDGGTVPALPPDTVIPERESFWAVFAVFFPAVTGIEAGIAMSGDLKDPAKSLPTGTIAAVVVGYVVYVAIPFVLAASVADSNVFLVDPLIMQKVARWGGIVVMGIWAASLSSALGALLGAPRTLQALANDGLVPRAIGKSFGEGNDPRIATAISFAIGLTGVLLGDLNLIAPILSMFFLTSYGALNLSAGLEEMISAPSWRPKFRVPARFGILGFISCLAVMVMIDPGSTIIAVTVTSSIYYFMKRRSLSARWGDMRSGAMMFATHRLLYNLATRDNTHERNWQPNILVLSGAPSSRWYLIELADAMTRNKHFLTVATVVPPTLDTERVANLTDSIREYLRKRNVQAFVKIFRAKDTLSGIDQVVRAYGFGPLAPNTIMIGETENIESYRQYSFLIGNIVASHRNVIIVREHHDENEERERQRIDVWTKGDSKNTGLLFALASLMNRSDDWKNSEVVVKRIVDSEASKEAAERDIGEYFESERINARIEIIINDSRPFLETIRDNSLDASLVILGMRPPFDDEAPADYAAYYENMIHETNDLRTSAFVIAGQNVDFKKLFMQDQQL